MAGLVKVPQRLGIDTTKLAHYIQVNVPEIAQKVAPSNGLGVQFFRFVIFHIQSVRLLIIAS